MKIGKDQNELWRIRCEANGLYDQMCQLESGIYAMFWHKILHRVNAISQTLQNPKLDLNTAVTVLTFLSNIFEEKRNFFDLFKAKGAEKIGVTYSKQTRKRHRNLRSSLVVYGQGQEAELSR